MGVPQIIMIVIYIINIGVSVGKHGKEEITKANAWTTILAVIINVVILYYGGFWN